MTTIQNSHVTARVESLQNAIDRSDWETAFQQATWLSNYYPLGSLEAEHYGAQARTYAARVPAPSTGAAEPGQSAATITDQLLSALRAMGANQTHAAPAGATFNIKIDVDLNKPPF